MQGTVSARSRVAEPTPAYARLLARNEQARSRLRPRVPVSVLARLLHFGGEVSHRGDAIVIHFAASTWQSQLPERRRYLTQALARYRDVYAVMDGSAIIRRDRA